MILMKKYYITADESKMGAVFADGLNPRSSFFIGETGDGIRRTEYSTTVSIFSSKYESSFTDSSIVGGSEAMNSIGGARRNRIGMNVLCFDFTSSVAPFDRRKL